MLGQPVTEVVPDVHLPAQGPDLNDRLAQEIVRLPLEALLDTGLDVIIFVPDTDLDAVGGVMALAGEARRGKPRDEQGNLSSLSTVSVSLNKGDHPRTRQELGKRADVGAPTLPSWLGRALHHVQAAPTQPGSAPVARSQTLHGTKPALPVNPAALLHPQLGQDEAPADSPPPFRDVLTASAAQRDREWLGRGMEGPGLNLQMEILLPDWVQVAVDSFSPFFCLSNLDSDIRVTGTRLILCLQALGTNDCSTTWHGTARTPIHTRHTRGTHSRENRQREESVPQPHRDPHNRHLVSPGRAPGAETTLQDEGQEGSWSTQHPWARGQPRGPPPAHGARRNRCLPVMLILADHLEVPSRTLCFTAFICCVCVVLVTPNTSWISSNISGLLRSRIFMRSLSTMMIFWVRSSAPCLELFSAAPGRGQPGVRRGTGLQAHPGESQELPKPIVHE